MPNASIKSLAQKTGKSIAEVEAKWREAKKAAEGEKSKGDDAFYGTAMIILKRKLGIKESRMKFGDYVKPTLNEEKFNGHMVADKKTLALIKLFQGKEKIKDHKDIHSLAEKLGIKEPSELEEVVYAMLQSFWSKGRAMEKGMNFKLNDEEVKMGVEVEMEHTDNELIAYRIALDHLAECSDYYTRLAKMEMGCKD
jgi:hypothetical protein